MNFSDPASQNDKKKLSDQNPAILSGFNRKENIQLKKLIQQNLCCPTLPPDFVQCIKSIGNPDKA